MVGVFGAEMAVLFSPKDLGVNAGNFWDYFRTVQTRLWTAFKRFRAKLLCLFRPFRDELSDC